MGWCGQSPEAAMEKVQSPFLPVGDFKIVSQESQGNHYKQEIPGTWHRETQGGNCHFCLLLGLRWWVVFLTWDGGQGVNSRTWETENALQDSRWSLGALDLSLKTSTAVSTCSPSSVLGENKNHNGDKNSNIQCQSFCHIPGISLLNSALVSFPFKSFIWLLFFFFRLQ